MISSTISAYTRASYIQTQQSAAKGVEPQDAQTRQGKEAAGEQEKAGGIEDVVTISAEAKILSVSLSVSTGASRFAPYFPAREGYSSQMLADTVTNPGLSNTEGMALSDVARDVRARMDEKYQRMNESGEPFDYNSREGRDWYALMGDLDRRSLYAVYSNQGGQFTKQEQDMAQSIMVQQQGLAMGGLNGPSRLEATHVDPFGQDHAARMKAGVKFLDGVSDEEKTSVAWAAGRAAAQTSYEWIMADRGGTMENLESDNPLVRLIRGAMETMKQGGERGLSSGIINNADDLKAEKWFAGFEDRLDALLDGVAA